MESSNILVRGLTNFVDVMFDSSHHFYAWFLCLYVVSAMGYFGFGFLVYHYYYKNRADETDQWKIQPNRSPKFELQRTEVIYTFGNLLICCFELAKVIQACLMGKSNMYLNPLEHGLPYLICSSVGFFVAIDGYNYYYHRAMHTIPWAFKNVHSLHHRDTVPTPLSALYMHPLECVGFVIVHPLLAFFRINLVALVLFIFGSFFMSVLDHSGAYIDMPFGHSPEFHDDHHHFIKYNYGQFLTWFDKFHGTEFDVSLKKNRRAVPAATPIAAAGTTVATTDPITAGTDAPVRSPVSVTPPQPEIKKTEELLVKDKVVRNDLLPLGPALNDSKTPTLKVRRLQVPPVRLISRTPCTPAN